LILDTSSVIAGVKRGEEIRKNKWKHSFYNSLWNIHLFLSVRDFGEKSTF
jgi:hypothetical protein